MPTDVYSNVADAQADISSTAVFDIPREFNTESSTGYLIAKITFQKKSGTWNNLGWTDLRGSSARSAAGAGSTPPPGSIVNFPDDLFTIYDTLDTTKIINFTLDGFSTLETHNYTPPRGDGTFALLEGITGGQTLYGGNAASDTLTIEGTSNATKGYTLINPSGGNVGIGTNAPESGLHIKGAYPTGYLTVERTGLNGLGPGGVAALKTDAKTVGDAIAFTFQALDSTDATQTYAQLRMEIVDPTAGSEDSKLSFWTNNAGTNTQQVTISETGNVGIGTTNPSSLLHIYDVQDLLMLENTNNDQALMYIRAPAGYDKAIQFGSTSPTND